MSDHDIQLLAIGVTCGMYIMLIAQVIGGVIDDRRDRKAARAARATLDRKLAAAAGSKVSVEDLDAVQGIVPGDAVLTAEAVRATRDSK